MADGLEFHEIPPHEVETAKKALEKQGRSNKSTYNLVGQKAHKGVDK
jgi:hypothetical protein